MNLNDGNTQVFLIKINRMFGLFLDKELIMASNLQDHPSIKETAESLAREHQVELSEATFECEKVYSWKEIQIFLSQQNQQQ